jgi:hypothetical protein
MSHAGVMVRCPTTGRELSTGVEMDTATFERLPDIHSRIQVSALPCGSQLVNSRSLAASFLPVVRKPPMSPSELRPPAPVSGKWN